MNRRTFIFSAGATAGGTVLGAIAGADILIATPLRLDRQTLRNDHGRWIQVPSFTERIGDRVVFRQRGGGQPATIVARFVVEPSPSGDEIETILSPIAS